MSVFPNMLTPLFFWRYFIRQKYCCFMLWLFQNVENWQKLRPPHLCCWFLWARPCWHRDQESPGAQCYPSVTSQVGAFDSKGTVMSSPRAWIWASSEKSVVQDHQVRKYNLAISVLRKRLLFPSVSLPYTRAATYLAIPAYSVGEVAKTGQKKGLKPLWIMYQMGTNFHH